jgi:aspartate racemase
MKRNILIIGGMGPQASLKLHEHIVTKAAEQGAKNADDFPAITHLSLPFPDFISDEKNKLEALDVIKRQLYYLWR